MTATAKLVLAGLVCLAVLAAAYLIHKDGADSVRDAIERQNNAAGGKADDVRDNYDRCLDDGRVWNFGAGRCDRSTSGRRG